MPGWPEGQHLLVLHLAPLAQTTWHVLPAFSCFPISTSPRHHIPSGAQPPVRAQIPAQIPHCRPRPCLQLSGQRRQLGPVGPFADAQP